MSLYLPVKEVGGSMAVAICYRCQKKIYYGELKQDPNNEQWYCTDCIDLYDPWRLPALQPEDITLHHPRPERDIE